MRRHLLLFLSLVICTSSVAQKYVSVVEVLCNTGNAGANQVFPELTQYAGMADTSDLNELYIQYHVPVDFPDWTDEYVGSSASDQWELYEQLDLVSEGCAVMKNGELSTAENWYDCEPEDKYIYGLAKKVTVLFDAYDPFSNSVDVEIALYTEYDEADSVFVHVLALEDELAADVTGGDNPGVVFALNKVVRTGAVFPATDYSTIVTLDLPDEAISEQVTVVAFVQDHTTGAVLGGTRGIDLEPYINAPGDRFAVVENFVNSGCFGGPPAINSMSNYVELAENNNENQTLVQLHIGQTYGNWSDVYKMPMNSQRYDKYAWDMGIIAGLAAVAKNGIRYKEDTWNNCSPLEKTSTDFVELEFYSLEDNQLVVEYELSGNLDSHDRVYFYVVERNLEVLVTGAEIPGTQLNMNNVARVGRRKHVQSVADTVLLHIPSDVQFENARVLAYIQNDVTYEITGGTKGFLLSTFTDLEDVFESGFELYPNPVDGHSNINLKFPNYSAQLTVQIHSMSGQQVFEKAFSSAPSILSISDLTLPAGAYRVCVTQDAGLQCQKLIVQ